MTVVPAAMTDGAQPTVKFAIFGASGISRVADGGASGSASVRDVEEAVSLDDYCAAHGIAPAVVKVDVEGAELGVLRGGRRVIAATAWAADCSCSSRCTRRCGRQSAMSAADISD